MQVKTVNRYKNISKAQAKFEFIDVFFLFASDRKKRKNRRKTLIKISDYSVCKQDNNIENS